MKLYEKCAILLLSLFFIVFPMLVALLTNASLGGELGLLYFAPLLLGWTGIFGWFTVLINPNVLNFTSVVFMDVLLIGTAWAVTRRSPTRKTNYLLIGMAYACLSEVLYLIYTLQPYYN